MGKSKSKQKTDPTTVWPEYGNAFANLQNQSQTALSQAIGKTGQVAGGVQSGLNTMLGDRTGQVAGQTALNRLGGVGGYDPYLTGAQNSLANLANSSGYDPQLAAYSRQVGQNFNENIMPGITGGALSSNTLGGSRAQVGAAQAAGAAQRNIQDFAGQQYNQQQNRALQAAGQLGQLSNQRQQNILGAGQALGNIYGQNQTANLGALSLYGKLPTLYQQPYLNQRQILGSPITIGGGGSSKGKSFGL